MTLHAPECDRYLISCYAMTALSGEEGRGNACYVM